MHECTVSAGFPLSCLFIYWYNCVYMLYVVPINLSYLILSYLISSHLISSHFISSHFTSPHLTSSYLIICNKLDDLNSFLLSSSSSLLGIIETWLDDSWPNKSVINNSSCSIIRNDRNRLGGGSAIVFNNSQLKLKSTSSAINQSFNVVCGLFHKVTSDLNIICCYLPPKSANQSNDIIRINDLICCLSLLLVESATNIIIGDFNFKEIDWACIDVSGYSQYHLFSKFLLDHAFSQFVLEPTREASILDLVLCDNLYTIDHVYCTVKFLYIQSQFCLILYKYFCQECS